MITICKNIYQYRELIKSLHLKNIIIRYKQASRDFMGHSSTIDAHVDFYFS